MQTQFLCDDDLMLYNIYFFLFSLNLYYLQTLHRIRGLEQRFSKWEVGLPRGAPNSFRGGSVNGSEKILH